MKVFILTSELNGNGPIWMNIFWGHYNAIASSVPTVLLTTPDAAGSSAGPKWLQPLKNWRHGMVKHPDLMEKTILNEIDPEGPNILLVWALRHSDVVRADRLAPVWDRFDHKVLSIVDNLEPLHVIDDIKGRFDLITSFCGDLSDSYSAATGVPSLYFPPHTDVLNFGTANDYRPLDLFAVGRRVPEIHAPLHHHFNAMDSNRISVDYVSRSVNFSYSSEQEFTLLMANYARSKASFCFEASSIDRFQNRSPLTERWVHAWAAGCTVIGSTPTGKGVAEATDWPEAMIDLPHDAEAARALVEGLLADEEGLRRRRFRNLEETMRRHDTRHRIASLLDSLDVPQPDALQVGLARLAENADALAAERLKG